MLIYSCVSISIVVPNGWYSGHANVFTLIVIKLLSKYVFLLNQLYKILILESSDHI